MILKEQLEIGKIRRGDLRAFEGLFHRNYPGMMAYAASLLKQVELAEEVVQDVFYNIWKNREGLRIQKSLKSYLYRAVYNQAMMELRKTRREVKLDQDLATVAPGDHWDPFRQLSFKETSGELEEALARLPEKTRQIFIMSRQEGLRYKEIAEKMSVSVKTVEAHMSKALKALKQGIKKE